MEGRAPPIGAHAIIGDCRSAALIALDGTLDWMCWPRFDSPPIFDALLDWERGGVFRIAPVGPSRVARRYLDDTNVLETRFEHEGGAAVLTDLMPVASEADKRRILVAEHEVLRRVECVEGEVEIEVRFAPRPAFGARGGPLRVEGPHGLVMQYGPGVLRLTSEIPLLIVEDRTAAGRLRLRAGEAKACSLTYTEEAPAVLSPLGPTVQAAIDRSVAWWRGWSGRADYDGPYREAVLRSALTLKLLAYAPSGAIVAAPTTSLPERPGGPLNWDYRYCWLRDASFTARALLGLGYADEAEAFASWLLHATRLTRPRLEILYDVFGRRPPRERDVDLAGYRGSRPVRVGNAAVHQLQLDTYGEVIDAVCQLVRHGSPLDRDEQDLLRGFGELVCREWRRPDEGIWEPRTGRAEHAHSLLLCWTALDRLLELHRCAHIRRLDLDRVQRERRAIREEIEQRAWDSSIGSYVNDVGRGVDGLDAALLLIPWYGFERADTPRMRSTWRRLRGTLGDHGLLRRYLPDRGWEEGAFGICCFWEAEYLALGGGSARDARRTFERILAGTNDLGLFAEEIDPSTNQPLGNFPQAFTHVGLINAAFTIAQREHAERRPAARSVRARPVTQAVPSQAGPMPERRQRTSRRRAS